MPQIAIINASNTVSDAAGNNIVRALNVILPQFCRDWGMSTYTAVFVGKSKTTNIKWRVFMMDSSDVSDALGYHSLDGDIPYGKAFAQTILDVGGALLYSSDLTVPTFAQTVAHEVFELIMDPNVNTWWENWNDQCFYAAEVSDPVQGNPVVVELPSAGGYNITKGSAKSSKIKVTLSDWVLPSWSNPESTHGPYNHNNTLTAPFTLDPYGYIVKLVNGQIDYVFGTRVSAAKRGELSKKKER